MQIKEQEHIPIIGPFIDRRMLRIMTKLLSSKTVEGLVCFTCANVRTNVKSWANITGSKDSACRIPTWSDIKYYAVEDSLWIWMKLFPKASLLNFSLEAFKERYASNTHADGNPFLYSTGLDDDNFEWQALLLCEDRTLTPIRTLCCPEDIQRSAKCSHPPHVLCGSCRIPICRNCFTKAWNSKR